MEGLGIYFILFKIDTCLFVIYLTPSFSHLLSFYLYASEEHFDFSVAFHFFREVSFFALG